jgi:hypothetical protein
MFKITEMRALSCANLLLRCYNVEHVCAHTCAYVHIHTMIFDTSRAFPVYVGELRLLWVHRDLLC